MNAVRRSFQRNSDFLYNRFCLVLMLAVFVVAGAVNTSPGHLLHPYNTDTDGVPSIAVVVEGN